MTARILGLFGAFLLATALLTVGGASSPAAAAPLLQCTGEGDDGDGFECDVTIANQWNVATGTGSSTVVTRVCEGPANTVFEDEDCTVTSLIFPNDVTTTVNQCNGTGEGGGSSLRCTVTMTNTIVGTGTPSGATVNQCIGSRAGEPVLANGSFCDPVQETTDAIVTQCNGSVNGGGGYIECTVGESTVSSALPVTINQCNNSVNGGGGLLVCSTSITTVIVPAADDDGGTDGDGTGANGAAQGDELADTGVVDHPLAFIAGATILLGAALLGAARTQRARQTARI